MSHCKFFGAIAFLLCTSSPSLAGELTASDIEIVAVIPRSPDVKPYIMPVSGDGHRSVAQTRKERQADEAAAKLAKAAIATTSMRDPNILPPVSSNTR